MAPVLSVPALALDTSGSYCSVALRLADGTLLHRESDGAGDHFERISGIVSELLLLGGVRLTDLNHIRIGVGPGSFTGLRIGTSFAKGMSMAAQIPLIGVCSFAGLAHGVAARSAGVARQMLVVADARREEVFLARYGVGEDGMIASELSSPCIVPVAGVLEWTAQHPQGVMCTPNVGFEIAQGVRLQVESRIAEGLLLLDLGPIEPFSTARVAALEPNYLRAVAAKSIEERKGP